VLILDEPTSALGAQSTELLFDALRVLRDRQVGVVFVSHILEDVMALCDEVTVLRDGEVAMSERPRAQLTVPIIVDAMLGERTQVALNERVARDIDSEAGRLELRGVSLGDRLRDFSLSVGSGEIVGLAGVAGAGHHAVLELVSGIARPSSGEVRLPSGKRVPHGLRAAIRSGVALVTGDRRRLGLMLDKPIYENIGQIRAVGLAAGGWVIRAGDLRRPRAGAGRVAAHPQLVRRPAGGGPCQAATSRRSCSPSGSTRSRRSSCSTTRRAGWTSAPRRRCTR